MGVLHIVDFEHGAVVGQESRLVGELAAGLRVERGAVEDDLDVGRAGHGGHGTLPSCMMPITLARADMSV